MTTFYRHPEVRSAEGSLRRMDSSSACGGLKMTFYVLATVLVLWLFVVSGTAFAASSPSLFAEANGKYQAGDFKGAAALYQKAIQSGNGTAAVYYNLGNTSLRLGQKGEALVYYRRALKASPRDKDLQWNVRVLQGALQDRIEETSLNLPRLLLQNATELWTLDEVGFAFTLALALLVLLIFVGYLFPALAAVLGSLRPLLFILLFGSAVLFGFQWWDTKDPRAVILDKEVVAHYGPSDGEAKAFVLHEGAEGNILDASGDWVYIALKNKNTGWRRKNSCEIV